jgi:predicted sulfurtransferase
LFSSRNFLCPRTSQYYKGKKAFTYYEKSEKQRAEYTARVKRVSLSSHVYVDENGINTWFQREYARATRGMIIEDTKHGAKFNRVNITGALRDGKHSATGC